MRNWHQYWKDASDKLELLQANPRLFIWKHGSFYGIDTKSLLPFM